MVSAPVPELRIRTRIDEAVNPGGRFVLYWMTAQHRTGWNFGLQRAVEWCRELGKPLVVLDILLADDPWANDRLHTFAVDGMRDVAENLSSRGARYYPVVEAEREASRGLVAVLAEHACVVVADDFPQRHLDRVVARETATLRVLVELVDSNGLLPMRAAPRAFGTAFAFRRFLQKELPRHLAQPPKPDPLRGLARLTARLPAAVTRRWRPAGADLLGGSARAVSALRIDHSVGAVAAEGGMRAARRVLKRFVGRNLDHYVEGRSHPDDDATSGLSPYLHHGHISPHEVFHAIARHEAWSPRRLTGKATGGRAGWWRMSESAEAFLDQLVTWRELGYNMSRQRDDHDRYASLPDWARATLAKHAKDERPYTYTLDELRAAQTHDPLWNAAQTQLVREGFLVNYLRMIWGKRILEWTRSPEEALDAMIQLNNTYALDGRNPNSYSGIFWCLGRYDRPWGPERPIFGTVRYMSSENTLRKLRCREYVERYAPA